MAVLIVVLLIITATNIIDMQLLLLVTVRVETRSIQWNIVKNSSNEDYSMAR